MPETWATFGVDLHLDLTGTRLRAGLEHGLRDAVRDGRLHPGTRLPSSRALAADLGIARNTVADAYAQLVAEGWLTAQPGSATRVAERAAATAPPSATPQSATRPSRYDLRAGSPDLAAFPRNAWLKAARRALIAAPDEAFGYSDVRGRPELRHALAEYLSRARGVHADVERLVICSGFSQGLALLCAALVTRDASRMTVEAYGLANHRRIVADSGLSVSTVPIDTQGAVVNELGDTDAVVLTPAHQFPLGVAMSPHRRTETIRWAADHAGLVIEDDYDGEFRYDRQPVGALQARPRARRLRRHRQQVPRPRPPPGLARPPRRANR